MEPERARRSPEAQPNCAGKCIINVARFKIGQKYEGIKIWRRGWDYLPTLININKNGAFVTTTTVTSPKNVSDCNQRYH
jgi:hypothetical protein